MKIKVKNDLFFITPYKLLLINCLWFYFTYSRK